MLRIGEISGWVWQTDAVGVSSAIAISKKGRFVRPLPLYVPHLGKTDAVEAALGL